MLNLGMRFVVPLILLGACSGKSENAASSRSALTGPLELRLVNVVDGDETAPATAARHIVVTISRVDARLDDKAADFLMNDFEDDAWTTLSVGVRTLDLLALPADGFASLGVARLPASGVERLRLFVDAAGPNYVVSADRVRHPLVVPSDAIQVAGDFDAEACDASGFVTLAFAGEKSIEVHPLGGGTDEWVLRPIVRVREVVASGVCPLEDDVEGPHRGDPVKN